VTLPAAQPSAIKTQGRHRRIVAVEMIRWSKGAMPGSGLANAPTLIAAKPLGETVRTWP
jgi:hypothetical protein